MNKFLIEKVAVSILQQEKMTLKYFNELLITGKVLEKIYINSTDIEFAQFYNKELALRLDSYSNDSKFYKEIQFDNIAF